MGLTFSELDAVITGQFQFRNVSVFIFYSWMSFSNSSWNDLTSSAVSVKVLGSVIRCNYMLFHSCWHAGTYHDLLDRLWMVCTSSDQEFGLRGFSRWNWILRWVRGCVLCVSHSRCCCWLNPGMLNFGVIICVLVFLFDQYLDTRKNIMVEIYVECILWYRVTGCILQFLPLP